MKQVNIFLWVAACCCISEYRAVDLPHPNEQYEDYIKSLPIFKPSDLATGGIAGACTATPAVNFPLGLGS